jgi:hypothetical protein
VAHHEVSLSNVAARAKHAGEERLGALITPEDFDALYVAVD